MDLIVFFFERCTGLRQGKNLSPVLFAVFLKKFELYLESKGHGGVDVEFLNDDIYFYIKFVLLLYADDTAIIYDTEEDFQVCLNNFVDYCKLWKLTLIMAKQYYYLWCKKK